MLARDGVFAYFYDICAVRIELSSNFKARLSIKSKKSRYSFSSFRTTFLWVRCIIVFLLHNTELLLSSGILAFALRLKLAENYFSFNYSDTKPWNAATMFTLMRLNNWHSVGSFRTKIDSDMRYLFSVILYKVVQSILRFEVRYEASAAIVGLCSNQLVQTSKLFPKRTLAMLALSIDLTAAFDLNF